jgi:MSHA biogenesis protein MshL
MVVHPSVSGEISLNLKNVSVSDVMEAVREVYGYEFRRSNLGWLVLPSSPQTQIFQVDYLNVKRAGKSEVRVSSGQISERVSGSGGNNNTGSAAGGQQQTTLAGSQIQTETAADFWVELQQSLNALVLADPEGSVVISPQTGIVVVRARPPVLRQVERFLAGVESTMHRQVVLEAKVLEVSLNDSFQAGINWAALGRPAEGQSVLVGQTGGGNLVAPQQENPPFGLTGGTVLLGGLGQPTSTLGGVFSAAVDLNDFAALIELLKTQGDVQVLSSPRVATVNNQKAVIKVGSDEFFVTGISSDATATAGNLTQSQDIELTPFFSGIALDVTPQISASGDVTLHIHPSVSEVRDQTKTVIVSGQGQSLPLALSTIRESDSIVRARSGQVVVIGGLMQTRGAENRAGTPLLSDLPLVGPLFRHTAKAARKSELVILLKPIVIGDGTWDRLVNDTAQRMRLLQKKSIVTDDGASAAPAQ